MKKKHVLIVGIGLNGSCVSNELIKNNFKVTAIDSHDFLEKDIFNKSWQKSDFSKIKNSFLIVKSLILYNFNNLKNPIIYRLNSLISDKSKKIISVNKKKFKTYEINKIGGRGHLWGRVSPRFPKSEFSKSEEWPLSYNQIRTYYKEIEKKFKLTGEKNSKQKLSSTNIVIKKKFNKIEKKLINFVKRKWSNRNATVLPTLNYNSGPLNPMLKEIINNKNFSIIKNSVVSRIILSKKGKAKGLEFVDRISLKKSKIYSDYIFLSASPIETVKILLNSKSKKFKNGIGNNTELLGKNFFDHIGISFNAFLDNSKKNYTNEKFDPLNPNKKTNGFYYAPFRNNEKKKCTIKIFNTWNN